MNKNIENFIKKYNELAPAKYQFNLIKDKFVLSYKVEAIKTFVYIEAIEHDFILVEGTHDNEIFYIESFKNDSFIISYCEILEYLIKAKNAADALEEAYINLPF